MTDPYPAIRMKAIESLLIEKGHVSEEMIDRLVAAYEADVGPLRGARVVARAWTDDAFKSRLLTDAGAAMKEIGVDQFVSKHLVAVENTESTHNVIVCTLCSCYPWGVLGLPPGWYKSPEYRARVVREPRAVLGEFGLELPDDVEIRLWDSSAEVRYFVVPRRPVGTEGMAEEALAALVTRDSMIGTGVPNAP